MRASALARCVFRLALSLPLAASAQWAPTNGPIGPIVEGLATDGTSLFATSNNYGIVQSRDRGDSWRSLRAGFLGLPVSGALIARGDTVYYGNERGVQIHAGGEGAWRQVNEGLGEDTLVHALSFGWGGLLAVTYQGRLYRSLDQGGHWARLDTNQERWLMDWRTSVLALDGDCAFMAGVGGVRRSLDRGRTWTLCPFGTQDSMVSIILFQAPYLFASTGRSVYRSADSGATWRKLDFAGLADSTGIRTLNAIGSRLYAFAYQGGLLISSDAGGTWTGDSGFFNMRNTFPEAGIIGLGSDLCAGTNTGIWRSTDLGRTWRGANTGIGSYGIGGLAVAGSGRLAAHSGSRAYVTEDRGLQWRRVAPPGILEDLAGSGDGFYAFAPDTGMFYSRDGAEWERIFSAEELGPPYPGLRLFALGPDVYYAGFESSGPFLGRLSAGKEVSSPYPPLPRGSVRALALCAGTPYAIVADTLRRYDAALRQWRTVASPPSTFAMALGSQGTALVLGTTAGLFRSADSGTTWTRAADSAAFGRIYALLEAGEYVFAGTDSGVAVSRNGGTWERMDAGLEAYPSRFQVGCLAVQDGYLFAGMGLGVWRFPLAAFGDALSPRRASRPEKALARWTLVSEAVGFGGAMRGVRRDARGRALAPVHAGRGTEGTKAP